MHKHINKKEVKVLDCTIRDGGLINDHRFSDEFVRAVYLALSLSGIDYMEFGYRSSKELSPPSQFGPWKYCHDDKIASIIAGIDSDMKLSVMIDAHRIKEQTFRPADQSPFDLIRTATYVKDIDLALDSIFKAHELGYETSANIMAISRENQQDLTGCLKKLAASPVDVVYIVDSFGGMYMDQVEHLMKLFQTHLPEKKIGIHCHNNLQMALGNTIAAIMQGADFADGSLAGIGRGCGNCCLELLIGYLNYPHFNLTPVLQVIEEQLLPLRKDIEWGYIIPYMITGLLNQHPRPAIAVRKTPEKDQYAKFFSQLQKTIKSSD